MSCNFEPDTEWCAEDEDEDEQEREREQEQEQENEQENEGDMECCARSTRLRRSRVQRPSGTDLADRTQITRDAAGCNERWSGARRVSV